MSTLKVSALTDGTSSVAVDNVIKATPSAWVSFDGTAAEITVKQGFNVSSVTDNGTGNYTVNFTKAIPSNSLCLLSSTRVDSNTTTDGNKKFYNITATSVGVRTCNTSDAAVDHANICLAMFGGF